MGMQRLPTIPKKGGSGTTITVKGRGKLSVACGVTVDVVLLPYAALEEDSTHIPDNIELQIRLSLQRPPGSRQSHADSSFHWRDPWINTAMVQHKEGAMARHNS